MASAAITTTTGPAPLSSNWMTAIWALPPNSSGPVSQPANSGMSALAAATPMAKPNGTMPDNQSTMARAPPARSARRSSTRESVMLMADSVRSGRPPGIRAGYGFTTDWSGQGFRGLGEVQAEVGGVVESPDHPDIAEHDDVGDRGVVAAGECEGPRPGGQGQG